MKTTDFPLALISEMTELFVSKKKQKKNTPEIQPEADTQCGKFQCK